VTALLISPLLRAAINAESSVVGKVAACNEALLNGTFKMLRNGVVRDALQLGSSPVVYANGVTTLQINAGLILQPTAFSPTTDAWEIASANGEKMIGPHVLLGPNEAAPDPSVTPFVKMSRNTTKANKAVAAFALTLTWSGVAAQPPQPPTPPALKVHDLSIDANQLRPRWGFAAKISQPLNTLVESEIIVMRGLSAQGPFSAINTIEVGVGGMELRVNGSAWGTSSPLQNGDQVQCRWTSGGTANDQREGIFKFNTGSHQSLYSGEFLLHTINNFRAPQSFQVGPTRQYQTPWALPQLAAGDTVEVDPATYASVGNFSIKASGTDALPITIKAANPTGARPIFDMRLGVDWGLRLQGHNIIVEGIEIYTHNNYNPAVPPTTGPGTAIRNYGTNNVVRDCYLHDCKNGSLGHDDYAGSLFVDRCWVENVGGLPANEPFCHGLYLNGNTTAYPSLTRVVGTTIRNVAGNGIKSREAYIQISSNRIELGNYPEAYYAIQATGPESANLVEPHSADILGNVVTTFKTDSSPIFVGGDGQSRRAKIRARIAKNTVIQPAGTTAAAIYSTNGLDSVLAIDNACLRIGGGNTNTPILSEYDVFWMSTARKFTAIKNGLPALPANVASQGGVIAAAQGSGNFIASPSAVVSVQNTGADVSRSANSVLTNAGTDLTTYVMPAGYELPQPLLAFDTRLTSVPFGTRLAAMPAGPANSTHVGAL
jgi:Right handed beta helix region